ncbi:aminoglycoside phosphotransferase family protein [Blastococcus brunescens]|uniref:Aminoglycoside phosphotransferase family protein n=1 Tax=Blastococcus brunescens TaxID=1564165 RepID=A0ABZ1B7Y8_9ACTN|nr:aminoglycoside phosphotransferase family protein [Blastococcus sp. BMG 8361]WRL66924.1 aminoglycoside phosphotransferase family protein [Blastococcus sp. BMG 8361]
MEDGRIVRAGRPEEILPSGPVPLPADQPTSAPIPVAPANPHRPEEFPVRPADADLAARDPALPGLPVLLDEQVLAGWLAGHGLGAARRRYLRYKPGTSCVLGLELCTGDGPLPAVLSAWSENSAPKLGKTRIQAPRGTVLAADERCHLLLTTGEADRDLPAIAALTGPDGPAVVLGPLLPGWPLSAATIQVLRYKPARRWVGVLAAAGREPVLLRVHRPAVTADLVSALTAFGTARVRTPGLVAANISMGLTIMEWLPGQALSDVPVGDRGQHLRTTGRVLAQLHQHPAPGLRRRPAGTAAESTRAGAALVAQLLPAQADRARDLAHAIGAQLRPPPGLRVCHGDFSADQVVVGPTGPALADLDEVALDDPAVDLASMTAGARLDEAGHDSDVGPVLAGYATIRALPPARQLAAHTAAALLRRAPEPFRLADPSWEEGVVHALDAAEKALS